MRVYGHHIETGPQEMYPVDLAAAVAQHPHEWSRVPWTDEARDKALPKLEEKRRNQAEDAERARRDAGYGLGPYDQTGAKVVGPIATQTQQAPAGLRAGDNPNTPPYAQEQVDAEARAAEIKALEEDVARAQNDLDGAKKDDKAAAQDRLDEARARLDAAKQP